jgi:hypothetical protein
MSIERFRTLTKTIAPGRTIEARYGFHYIHGNRRPYFSITGTIRDKKTGRRRDDYIESCGCIHDDIREHFPELAHLIRWHLVDDDASPTHYQPNAAYWLEFHHGISQWKFDEHGQLARKGRTALDVFKSTVVYREDKDNMGDLLEPIILTPPDKTIFAWYADGPEGKKAARAILAERVGRWIKERPPLEPDMRRDMDAAGVEYIDPALYPSAN